MTDQRTHVVVIGGGYAGTLAANHLRLRTDVDITLVNPRPVFVERIRLHQLVAGSGTAAVDYGTLLGEGIRLVVDSAERIDTANRKVVLSSGAVLDFDYLIYAVGSTGVMPSAVPGAAEFGYPIAEFEYAERLRNALDELHPDAPVTVVGAGLTGIEAASELAEQGRRVTLVCGGALGPSLSRTGRRSVAKWLGRLGVDVLETAVVTRVQPEALVLADGALLPSALTVWTAGFGVPDLATRSELSTDTMGRLLTDETLTSIDDSRIVAAGDAAAPSGHPLRMSCQAAGPLGIHAANTVLSRIGGTEPAVLNPASVGQCISLGRSHATFQFARADDTPVNVVLGGRVAASIKKAVCKATVSSIRREAAKPGSYFWFNGGKRPKRLAREVVTLP
jgi:NADH dehydrogenase